MTFRPKTTAGLIALMISITQAGTDPGRFRDQTGPAKSRLRGLSVVNASVVWASGADGTILRTIDGGKTWGKIVVPGTESLDFRDVHALDADRAWVLSIGEGEKSRIYFTRDGGCSWDMQYKGNDPRIFLDAISFWDERRGIAMGDPLDGRHLILATDDGGATWGRVGPEGIPPALPGEGAFAASGTCLITLGRSNVWFATGSAAKARVFRSTDAGRTWTVHETPIRAGNPSSGIFSLSFRDERNGIAVGGDYKEIGIREGTIALTSDGGRTWTTPEASGPSGYRSGAAYLGDRSYLVVGPGGADRSDDDGRTWKPIPNGAFHAVGFVAGGFGWGVGEMGRIGKWVIDKKVP